METRGLVGAFLTFPFLIIFQGYLVKAAQLRATTAGSSRTVKFMDLIITAGNPPDFIEDIFFESDDSLDLPRTQMFVWTVVSLAAFTVMLIQNYSGGNPKLPDITLGLVALMGLSNGAYLGAKVGTK